MAPPLASVGIISIGQMGLGIARLLVANNYRVLTNVSDRSAATQERAKSASLDLVQTDADVVAHSDYILSIVPPRDAIATATRIVQAFKSRDNIRQDKKEALYYLDLNAIAPSTARKIRDLLERETPEIRFVDGGIIGGPPALSTTESSSWTCPDIPLSGPHPLTAAPVSGSHLASTLNSSYLDEKIGTASGLKCTFAALSKGFTALSLQSFTTASSLGVLPALQSYLEIYNPGAKAKAEKSITGCPSKAYRWVDEMKQIGQCFQEDGGWTEEANVFRQVAGVFEELAQVVKQRGGTEGMGELGGAVGALERGLRNDKGDGKA